MSFLKSLFGSSSDSNKVSSNSSNSKAHSKPLPEWYEHFLDIETFHPLESQIQKPNDEDWVGYMAVADELVKPLVPPSSASLTLFSKITDEDTSPREAAYLAAEDPILAARILKAVNTSYYGLSSTISDVHTATNLIGLEQLKILVMAQILESNTRPGHQLEQIALHSSIVGQIAGFLAIRSGMNRSVMTTMGVLHDIGRLLAPFIHVEADAPFHQLHPEIQYGLLGGAFARVWKLPSVLIRCVEALPFASFGDVEEIGYESRTMIDLLAASQFLANAFGFEDGSPIYLPLNSVDNIQLDPDPKKWLNESQIQEIHKTSLLF